MQSFKKIGIKLCELCAQGTYCLYTEGEKRLSLQCGKSDQKKKKNDLTNIPKSHTHPHIMKKTQAKFQNN